MTEKEAYGQAFENGRKKGFEEGYARGLQDAVKHGYWKLFQHSKEAEVADYECSVCGGILIDVPETPDRELNAYCPMCGAMMDLKPEEEQK